MNALLRAAREFNADYAANRAAAVYGFRSNPQAVDLYRLGDAAYRRSIPAVSGTPPTAGRSAVLGRPDLWTRASRDAWGTNTKAQV